MKNKGDYEKHFIKFMEVFTMYKQTETSRELALFTLNDGRIYERFTVPTLRNLAKKKAKGTYDHEKAVIAMHYVATEGARAYVDEFCTAGTKYHEIFPKSDRMSAASEMLEHYASYLYELADELTAR